MTDLAAVSIFLTAVAVAIATLTVLWQTHRANEQERLVRLERLRRQAVDDRRLARLHVIDPGTGEHLTVKEPTP